MDAVTSWQEALTASWGRVWVSFLTMLPTVIGAIVIFSIGLVLAFWVKRLVMEILRMLKVEKISKSLGIDKFLTKAGVHTDFAGLIGTAAEWLIILVFFLATVDILGLDAVSRVLTEILVYIPNIIAAALILGAGYFVAGIVESTVRGALASVDHRAAKPVARLARWVVMLIIFFSAVEQLKIARGLVATFFQGLTYTIVLVVGLSVGLGSKDLVSRVLNDWYDKITKDK